MDTRHIVTFRRTHSSDWEAWPDDATPAPPRIEEIPPPACTWGHDHCVDWRGVHFRAIAFGPVVWTAREGWPPCRATPTADEERWMGWVAGLSCVVCRNKGKGRTPAEVHHAKLTGEASQRAGHMLTIPLCKQHHRTGGHGVAYHAGPEIFGLKYGSQGALLEQTIREIVEQVGSPRSYFAGSTRATLR